MIGIEFELETTYEKILYDLLKDTVFVDYKWIIRQQEIIYESNHDKTLLSYLSGTEWEKEIRFNGNYYVLFLNLQVYLKDGEESNIETYDDFVNSDCELIVLFSDNKFIEIYVKSNDLKKKIIKNIDAKKIKYKIKTKENDGRTKIII